MKVQEVFREMVRFAKANRGRVDIAYYVSGSQKKKTMLEKMLQKYIDDADIDFELGILNKDEHFHEMEVAKVIENSLNGYQVY